VLFHSENFMSPWQQPNQNKGIEISQQNKEYLKANVFSALDTLVKQNADKTIIAALEHIIYNMAQVTYSSWNGTPPANGQPSPMHQQLLGRLASNDVDYIVSGLRSLKAIVSAFEFEINADRKPLEEIAVVFFPTIESQLLMSQTLN
jgi:hypothetical protein